MKRILTLLAAALLLASTQVARASEQQEVVDGATIVADKIQSQGGAATNIRELLHRARALLVVPSLIKGGFFLGGQGGTGVLLVRDPKTNSWSSPAFYGLAGGSFGLQIGVEVSEVALIIMTDKALEAVLQNEFKVGAEAGLTLATVGAGAEASTTSNVGADIYSFSESKGLFGGIALQGAALNPKPDWDKIYYGRALTTREIVLERKAATSGATRLRTTLDSISQH